MNWGNAGPYLGPVAGAVAVVWAALVDRRAKHRTAAAADKAADAQATAASAAVDSAEAAEEGARAEMHKAVVAEREQASSEWAKITQGMQKWNEHLSDRLGDVEKRLDDAEIRNAAAELKVAESEKNYRVAIAYLRRVIRWVNDNWPGNDCPEAPPELVADL